jgi:hypothetical protein
MESRSMGKHTEAINVLNDELERVVRNVLYLQQCLGKSKLKKALFPEDSSILLHANLRWRRSMKEQLAKGNALSASIKALEALDEDEKS